MAGGTSSLSDHYTAAYGGARFDSALRDRLVFSDHSLATDNVFREPIGRFADIDEDTAPLHLLVSDYEKWVG